MLLPVLHGPRLNWHVESRLRASAAVHARRAAMQLPRRRRAVTCDRHQSTRMRPEYQMSHER